MSSHNQNENTATSPSFVSFVSILTFFIILGILSFGNFPTPVVEADNEVSVSVSEVATDVSIPTETDLPPTVTIEPTLLPTAIIEPTLEPNAIEENVSTTSGSEYDPDVISQGQSLFVSCGACHGPDGLGVPNLGKNLVESEFVHSLSDDELVDFVKTGRPIWDADNTTGIDMPPKGGNPTLTDDDIYAIVAYLRTLRSTSGVDEVEEAQEEELDNGNASATTYDPDIVAHGRSLFLACGACHGQDGLGLPNLGKPLVDSEFIDSSTDDELVTFIKTGRPIWDAENTTGIDMPPKGGNPTLTDDDILAIVAYIRNLNE